MTDSTDLTDLEHEFANTVARLRDHLPAIAEADPPADGGQASAADGVVFLDSVGPSTEPASSQRSGRRRDARRLIAVAAAVVVVFGVAVWWGDRSTDSGPSIADDTDGDSTFEVLPGEIVVSEDPLIVVLADPSPHVDAIGLEIDQPVTPVAVDGSLVRAPLLGWTESGWIEAEEGIAPFLEWALEAPGDAEVVEARSKTTIAGLAADDRVLFRVDSELLLADGTRYYTSSTLGSGAGDDDPIEDQPWFASSGTGEWQEGGEERVETIFGDLGDAVAIRLTTPGTVVTAGVAGGMAEIETTIVEQHTRVRLERLLPDGTWDAVLLDAGVLGLTGGGPDNPAGEITLESLDPELPSSTVTIYGAEWCAPCNDLDGFAADVEAARNAVEGSLVKVRLVAATREEWPDPERDWPFATGLRSAGVGQFSPTLPWVVITNGDGRFIYSGAIPTRAELTEAFEVLAAE